MSAVIHDVDHQHDVALSFRLVLLEGFTLVCDRLQLQAFGLFDYDILDVVGPGATMAICDFNHHNEGIIGGGLLANEFNRMPYNFINVRPPGSRGWGAAHKEFHRMNIKRVSRVVGPIQEMPNFESRIKVSPNVKDHWGIPVVQFSGARLPIDHEHCKFLSDKAERLLKETGAIETWKTVGGKGQKFGYYACVHFLGILYFTHS